MPKESKSYNKVMIGSPALRARAKEEETKRRRTSPGGNVQTKKRRRRSTSPRFEGLSEKPMFRAITSDIPEETRDHHRSSWHSKRSSGRAQESASERLSDQDTLPAYPAFVLGDLSGKVKGVPEQVDQILDVLSSIRSSAESRYHSTAEYPKIAQIRKARREMTQDDIEAALSEQTDPLDGRTTQESLELISPQKASSPSRSRQSQKSHSKTGPNAFSIEESEQYRKICAAFEELEEQKTLEEPLHMQKTQPMVLPELPTKKKDEREARKNLIIRTWIQGMLAIGVLGLLTCYYLWTKHPMDGAISQGRVFYEAYLPLKQAFRKKQTFMVWLEHGWEFKKSRLTLLQSVKKNLHNKLYRDGYQHLELYTPEKKLMLRISLQPSKLWMLDSMISQASKANQKKEE